MELEGTVEVPQNTGKITLKKQGKVTYVEYTYAREYSFLYTLKRKGN